MLGEGYVFLRTIEHYLQMMHYRQTHTLPQDEAALRHLAQRLGFRGRGSREQFLARYEQHRAAIRAVYLEHLGSRMMNSRPDHTVGPTRHSHEVNRRTWRAWIASYAEVFSEHEIGRHATLAAQLDSDNLVEVEAMPLEDERWRVTIVGYDYAGELSLICGLLFVYGLSIHDGHVFTYEPEAAPPVLDCDGAEQARLVQLGRSDWTGARSWTCLPCEPARGEVTARTWARYARGSGRAAAPDARRAAARGAGELAKQVAAALQDNGASSDGALSGRDRDRQRGLRALHACCASTRRTRSGFCTSLPTPWPCAGSTLRG